MNILQLISSTGFFGAENVVLQLSRALAGYGHTVTVGVITRAGCAPAWTRERYGGHEPVFFPSRCRFDPGAIAALRNFIRERRIDVLNSHNYKADFFGFWACRGTRVRKVATCHNWLAQNHMMRIYERIDKFLLRRFDAVIAVSPQLKEEILAGGIAANKVFLVANGITLEEPPACDAVGIREREGVRRDERVIMSVGRLSLEKGHGVLLQAFSAVCRSFASARLFLVGDGPERGRLEQEARHLGVSREVIFTGFRSDIPALLGAADIFVLPSLKEGMPLALLEAMACGRPCIATRVGAVPDVLGRDEYGLVVSAGDPHPLAQALLRFLKEPGLAAMVAARGRSRVRDEFSADMMARRYLRVYGHG